LSANVWTTASELAGVLVVSYALIQKRFESLAEPLIRLAKGVLDGGRGKVRGLFTPEVEGRFQGRMVGIIAHVADRETRLLFKLHCRAAIELTIAHKNWAARLLKAVFRGRDVVIGNASLDALYLFTADQPDRCASWAQRPEVHHLISMLMGGGTDRIELEVGVLQATHSGYTLGDVAEIKSELEDLDALARSLEETVPTPRA
jgi:hypothetical protein